MRPTSPPAKLPARRLSRREAMQALAAAGSALTLGLLAPQRLDARRTTMETQHIAGAERDAATATPKVVTRKLENDRVRVYDHVSNPGDREDWHTHLPMVVYVVTPGTLRITTPDGQSKVAEFKANEVIFRQPTTHATENIGTTQFHCILVELK
jgi:beta-alanine degradation protein BauB